MKYTENALNILTSLIYKGIGRAWVSKNLNLYKNINSLIGQLNKSSKTEFDITIDDFENKKNNIKKLIDNSSRFIDGVIAIGDENFPTHRGHVKDSEKPIFLFYKGNLDLLNQSNKNIAVIGLLNPDLKIENIERSVVNELVNKGATIVSGLALGCDTIAHRQALQSKGKTIAILPSPLSNILPSKNKDLAIEIVANDGLLITEYLTDAKSKMALSGRYQDRDRLQALFSDCIVLSASYAKNDLGNDSGSRLTMGYAANYKIQRAVIYNKLSDSDNPRFDLNRQCIKEDKNIIVINNENFEQSIDAIISTTTNEKNKYNTLSLLKYMQNTWN